MPRNFVQAFIEAGWEHIEFDLGYNRKPIRRWIAEHDAAALAAGTPLLCELRHAHLVAKAARHGLKPPGRRPNRERAIRYVTERDPATWGVSVPRARWLAANRSSDPAFRNDPSTEPLPPDTAGL